MNYKELNNTLEKIDKWYSKKIKVLSIKTRPFNTSKIFGDIINRILIKGSKILYVFSNNEDINNKKEDLFKLFKCSVSYESFERNFNVISISSIKDATEEYELAIFDDISLFSKINTDSLRDSIENVYWNSRKIIIYSIEFVFPIGERLDLIDVVNEYPIAEPRIMSTRIRLEEDIPLALFEYFKWFKKNKKRVIIVVPSEEKLNKVYNHYYGVLRELSIRVVKYNRNQNFTDIKSLISGYSDSLFIVSNFCGQYMKKIPDLNIIVLFADDTYYSYKKIVFMCGSLDNSVNYQSEMIMVSKEVTEEMDRARDITRGFNRVLWENQSIN